MDRSSQAFFICGCVKNVCPFNLPDKETVLIPRAIAKSSCVANFSLIRPLNLLYSKLNLFTPKIILVQLSEQIYFSIYNLAMQQINSEKLILYLKNLY